MRRTFTALTFVDVMCCTLGGALLLLLLVASAEPDAAGKPGRALVVRFSLAGGDRGELGLEARPPGAADYRRLPSKDIVFFSAPATPDGGAAAVAVVADPAPGAWRFRPYLVDWPARPTLTKEGQDAGLTVRGEAFGTGATAAGGRAVLRLPGDRADEPLLVTVPAAR